MKNLNIIYGEIVDSKILDSLYYIKVKTIYGEIIGEKNASADSSESIRGKWIPLSTPYSLLQLMTSAPSPGDKVRVLYTSKPENGIADLINNHISAIKTMSTPKLGYDTMLAG